MNIDTAIKAVKILRKADVPSLMHGAPGVGKTSAYKQAGYEIHQEEFNGNCKTLKDYLHMVRESLKKGEYKDRFLCNILEVPNLDPTDTMGIPFSVETNFGYITKWARPDFIHAEGNGILLFDELTNGDSLTTQSLRNIMLERRVKSHYLAPGWYPCGAGNRTEDKAFSRALPSPLITRLCHIGVACDAPNFTEETVEKAEVDPKGWIDWAMSNQLKS